jgi:GAF domain-containing protein
MASNGEIASSASGGEPERRIAELVERSRLRPEEGQALLSAVGAVVSSSRRREAVLDALRKTAAAIAELEVDEVLKATVARARELMGTDLAYLSIFDPDTGLTYVRASNGARSPGFNSLEVPLGFGVGGIVSETRRPFWTEDYIHDQRIQHVPRVDVGIGDEGVRAMLGVPLVARGRFLGALFAADRRVRPYASDEVALLEAFGGLAAIALENARLFERHEQRLAELRNAYEALRDRNAVTEKAAEVHDRLAALLVRRADPRELAELVAAHLDVRIAIYDAELELLAASDDRWAREQGSITDQPALRAALQQAQESGLSHEVSLPGLHRGATLHVAAAVVGGRELGALVLSAERALVGTELRIFERAGHVAAVLLMAERDAALERGWRMQALFDALLDAPRADEERERAAGLTLGIDAIRGAMAFDGAVPPDVLVRYATRIGAVAGQFGDLAVLLTPEPSMDAAAALQRHVARSPGATVTVGLSRRAAGPWRPAVVEAVRCHRLLTSLGREGEAGSVEELGVAGLLLALGEGVNVRAFVDEAIGPLIAHDASRRGALVQTVRAYLDCGHNARRASEALGIHYKTMAQRLDRVSELLGADWTEPPRLLPIHLAVSAWPLTSSPNREGG